MRKGDIMGKIYIAYGSNMNIKQMKMRCPTSKKIGVGKVKGYELLFKGAEHNAYATIEPNENAETDVVLWDITEQDEIALDHYEGFPVFYTKEHITVLQENGEELEGMVYVMDQKHALGMPTTAYFKTVLKGYLDNDMNPERLLKALSVNSHKIEELNHQRYVQKMEM